MEGLTEGRMTHYVLDSGPSEGQHRPAIVVKVWNKESGMVNLAVLTDFSNDGYPSGLIWKTSVGYSEEPLLNTWHWIEKA